MNPLHNNWIDINPMAAFPLIAILFLLASIAGWYLGNLIQWRRRTQKSGPVVIALIVCTIFGCRGLVAERPDPSDSMLDRLLG